MTPFLGDDLRCLVQGNHGKRDEHDASGDQGENLGHLRLHFVSQIGINPLHGK